jgi:hypothetical protein
MKLNENKRLSGSKTVLFPFVVTLMISLTNERSGGESPDEGRNVLLDKHCWRVGVTITNTGEHW